MNFLRFEIYKLIHNKWALPAFIGIVALAVYITSTAGIFTRSEMWQKYGEYPISLVRNSFDLPDSVENLGQAIDIVMNQQFPRVFWHMEGAEAIATLILVVYFICKDFRDRTVNIQLSVGGSRLRVFLSKFATCHIISIAAALITILILLSIYTSNWRTLPSEYVLRCIGLYLLLWESEMSKALMLAFLLHSAILTVGVDIVLVFIENELPRFLVPAKITMTRELWEPVVDQALLTESFLSPIIIMVVTTIVSGIAFARSEFR